MTKNQELVAWDEKYRPKTYSDFVDASVKIVNGKEVGGIIKRITRMLDGGVFKHLMFYGDAGLGKTTLADIVAEDWMERRYNADTGVFQKRSIKRFNASDDRGIDVVRNQIKRIVESAGSFVIILDEADAMTADAQTAMRRIMEKAKKSKHPKFFILTCNYPEKIIEPLHSRCEVIRFDSIPQKMITEKLQWIMEKEDVKDIIFSDAITPEEKHAELELFWDFIYNSTEGDLRGAISLCQEFVVYNEPLDKTVLDLNLIDKVQSKSVDVVDMMFKKVFSKRDPDFAGIVQFVEDTLKDNIFMSKIFRDTIFWLKENSRTRGGITPVVAMHMASTTAKFEARVRTKADVLTQFSALICELSLIFLAGYIMEDD